MKYFLAIIAVLAMCAAVYAWPSNMGMNMSPSMQAHTNYTYDTFNVSDGSGGFNTFNVSDGSTGYNTFNVVH